jgi:hypothetical protein
MVYRIKVIAIALIISIVVMVIVEITNKEFVRNLMFIIFLLSAISYFALRGRYIE